MPPPETSLTSSSTSAVNLPLQVDSDNMEDMEDVVFEEPLKNKELDDSTSKL